MKGVFLLQNLTLRAQTMIDFLNEVISDLADELGRTYENVSVTVNIKASEPVSQLSCQDSRFSV